MLNKRNLDDQSYRSIVESTMGRLPWICPVWTDHNSHDPGVTVLELMAWYKEMQQYQMNQVSDTLKEKLLKVAGVRRMPGQCATCAVVMEEEGTQRLPLSPLATAEGICFELEEAVPALRPRIEEIWAGDAEISRMLQAGNLTFRPFAFGQKQKTDLCLRIRVPGEKLRLWFQVVPPEGAQRNPFLRADHQPRKLRWSVEGLGEVLPLRDDTHALSQSGFITFSGTENWPQTGEVCSLRVELVDAGCEETVRLAGISERSWTVKQQETRAKSYSFTAIAKSRWEVLLADAFAREGNPVVFVRRDGGWQQEQRFSMARTTGGLALWLDTTELAEDGGENVTVVCLDPLRWKEMLFDMKGLPGETIRLDLQGKEVLRDRFVLWCNTLDRDGIVRLRPWHCVDDLTVCSPRDRVFSFDPVRETITFGDGAHGALVQRGEGAVLIADMVLSVFSRGNIPAQACLRFVDDGAVVEHTAANGGQDRESVESAMARLLKELQHTVKCAGAEDYENIVRTTPGLRVGAVKAIPGYDPGEPSGVSRSPVVTVVAAPASAETRPLPDEAFLSEVRSRLEALRPVGTRIHVTGPVYQEMDVTVRFGPGDSVSEKAVRRSAETYLSSEGAGIGGVVSPGELAALMQALPGVRRVIKIDIRPAQPGCYQNPAGEIQLSRCAIPCLRHLTIEKSGQR